MNDTWQTIRPADLLIISDLDDTLLNSRHEVSGENREAIGDFISLGGHFAIASGRTEPPVKKLGIKTNTPSVLYNGAAIYDLEKESFLWTRHLGPDIRPLILDLLDRYPEMGLEVITQKGNYVVRRTPETDEHIALEHLGPLKTGCSPDEIREPWMKVMLDWEGDKLREIQTYLDDLTAAGKIRFHYGMSYPILLEFNHPDANKGLALRRLSGITGIPLDHTIALGDNLNDLEMMQTAGFRIAPKNAREQIRALADYISVDNNHHIMKDILKQLCRPAD